VNLSVAKVKDLEELHYHQSSRAISSTLAAH
jgi:hypothetical protein